MTKDGHVEVISIPYNRYNLPGIEEAERRLNEACGTENVDWYIQDDYWDQMSVIQFTVKKDLILKARGVLGLSGVPKDFTGKYEPATYENAGTKK